MSNVNFEDQAIDQIRQGYEAGLAPKMTDAAEALFRAVFRAGVLEGRRIELTDRLKSIEQAQQP